MEGSQMNSSKRTVSAMLMLGGLMAATGAHAGAQQHDYTLPIVGLNNPCTAGHDSIDGSLDIHGVTKFGEGNVTFIRFNAKGSGEDVHGRKYNLNVVGKFQFHDPLPAQVFLRAKMVSQGAVDNPHLVLALHVNEQGNITFAEISGIECRG
jgi:hypothetical protein